MEIDEFVKALGKRSLFHFTDTRNIPSIKEHGLLSLRELRRQEVVVNAAGGNGWSQDSATRIGLDNYVNLCMRDRHPMEWLAKKDGRILETKFLNIKPEVLEIEGVRFTAGVSNKAGMKILTWQEASDQLDWEVLYEWTDWKDLEVRARLNQASKYEVLIPGQVPISMMKNL
ncbi:DUF4433 domain-containing protein [Mesorhizobium sp. B1-1-1]|uniref:DarT ssDNA thymidine ADP-ribosyltransferase family protein n=1 Tax=Mesorhizobium sp. B1-1-1 TaxID=2589983 RepID=UPI00112948E3|nr:DarT ssDNA thymidine ADP-ribosyltransferase family protein [Mesorhizobium sp. B1-1-1]TPN69028.1 DUF4433 domain-containing protein [Mesorhizobium sp. B1-1-1]